MAVLPLAPVVHAWMASPREISAGREAVLAAHLVAVALCL